MTAAETENTGVNGGTNPKTFRKALGDWTHNNLGQIKVLNAAVLGDKAPTDDAAYQEALALDPITRLVYFNDVCAGAVMCKKTTITTTTPARTDLQIVSLVVLPAYRRYGIGSMLVKNVLDETTKDFKLSRVTVCLSKNDADSEAAFALFSKFGFVEDAELMQSTGDTGIVHLFKSI
eukprot:jgi/Hompol1/6473/HPOL_002664-RA